MNEDTQEYIAEQWPAAARELGRTLGGHIRDALGSYDASVLAETVGKEILGADIRSPLQALLRTAHSTAAQLPRLTERSVTALERIATSLEKIAKAKDT